MVISNDAKFRHADTKALTESCHYPWTLPKKSSRVPKTVRVRFPGAPSAGTLRTDSVLLGSADPEAQAGQRALGQRPLGLGDHINASDVGSGWPGDLRPVKRGEPDRPVETGTSCRGTAAGSAGFRVRDRAAA